jgi:hypothetical protein
MINPHRYYTARETAEIIRCSVHYLAYDKDGLARTGKIKSIKRGRRLFLGQWIQDYLYPPVVRRETRGRKPKPQFEILEV